MAVEEPLKCEGVGFSGSDFDILDYIARFHFDHITRSGLEVDQIYLVDREGGNPSGLLERCVDCFKIEAQARRSGIGVYFSYNGTPEGACVVGVGDNYSEIAMG